MPLPLAPIAAFAVRTGLVAAAAYAVRRGVVAARRDQRLEDALDELPEGPSSRRAPGERQTGARFRRVIEMPDGRRVEIDLSAVGRLVVKRL